MKSTSVLRLCVMLAVTMFVLSTVDSAEAKLFGRCGKSCCEPSCCEPAPCCDPCDSGCKREGFLKRLCNRNKCCETTCCEEPTCCEPAPCCEEEVVVEEAPCCEPAPCCEETCCEDTCCKPSLCERIKCKLEARRAKRCGCGC